MSEHKSEILLDNEKQLVQQRLITGLCLETITKLQIFQRGLRLNSPVIVQPNSNTTKKVKNSMKTNTNEIDMKNMPDVRVLNAIKMDKELDTLIEMFSIAADEVQNLKSGEKTLKQLIAAQQANNNEVDFKTKELHQKETTLQSLKTQIETEFKESTKRLQSMDEHIANLRHNLRNVRRLNDIEFELVKRWEANRFTQASIVCNNEENALRPEIEHLDRQIAGEKRIINEIEKFNAKQFDEYRAKINEWKTKYATKIAKVTSETIEHEKRIIGLSKIQERHKHTYAERVAFVREYLAKKAEEQRLYEEQMHRVSCAIKLQAWWRGIMVRRGLGPYKKKAKKSKKGKGKGK